MPIIERDGRGRFRSRRWVWTAAITVTMAAAGGLPAWAQISQTISGPPVQVTPYAAEPGVPLVTVTPGTVTSATSTSTSTSSSGTTATTDSDALNTLLAQPWGSSAINDAVALGLNPNALAATCQVESGCNSSAVDGSYTGAFQMGSAAFQDGLATALAADPSLASQVVQGSAGINDPTTEAIAASGYLMEANTALESAGVSDPTVLDARGYYNFGPAYGSQLAEANADEPIATVLSEMSAFALASNGITSGETVGEWRTAVAAKMGTAATQAITS